MLVRADLNAPLRATGTGGYEVIDNFRLRSSVSTLTWLLEREVETISRLVIVLSRRHTINVFVDPWRAEPRRIGGSPWGS